MIDFGGAFGSFEDKKPQVQRPKTQYMQAKIGGTKFTDGKLVHTQSHFLHKYQIDVPVLDEKGEQVVEDVDGEKRLVFIKEDKIGKYPHVTGRITGMTLRPVLTYDCKQRLEKLGDDPRKWTKEDLALQMELVQNGGKMFLREDVTQDGKTVKVQQFEDEGKTIPKFVMENGAPKIHQTKFKMRETELYANVYFTKDSKIEGEPPVVFSVGDTIQGRLGQQLMGLVNSVVSSGSEEARNQEVRLRTFYMPVGYVFSNKSVNDKPKQLLDLCPSFAKDREADIRPLYLEVEEKDGQFIQTGNYIMNPDGTPGDMPYGVKYTVQMGDKAGEEAFDFRLREASVSATAFNIVRAFAQFADEERQRQQQQESEATGHVHGEEGSMLDEAMSQAGAPAPH